MVYTAVRLGGVDSKQRDGVRVRWTERRSNVNILNTNGRRRELLALILETTDGIPGARDQSGWPGESNKNSENSWQ